MYACDIENDAFSGMNGLVNERPYIVFNKNMSPERIRSTIAHEMAHFIFQWPDEMEDNEIEKIVQFQPGKAVHFFFQKQMQKESLVSEELRLVKI